MSEISDVHYLKLLYAKLFDRLPSAEELDNGFRALSSPNGYKGLLVELSNEMETRFPIISHSDNDLSLDYICGSRSAIAQDLSLSDRVRKLFARLEPLDVIGYNKVRIGRDWDGGYVMIDDFEGIEAAYSLGISEDVSWDFDIAELGIRVNQYDGTIMCLPSHHPRFNWQGLNVAANSDLLNNVISIKSALSSNGDSLDKDYLLKMDIEGDEWKVLAEIDHNILFAFRQIVCEVHGLFRIAEDEEFAIMRHAISNLTRNHVVVHVHANNNSGFTVIGGVVVPVVMELTLVRRKGRNFRSNHSVFPTHLDKPCSPQRPDMFLGSFRFF